MPVGCWMGWLLVVLPVGVMPQVLARMERGEPETAERSAEATIMVVECISKVGSATKM